MFGFFRRLFGFDNGSATDEMIEPSLNLVDTVTDPAYSYLPENIHHVDTVTDPTYSYLPENIHYDTIGPGAESSFSSSDDWGIGSDFWLFVLFGENLVFSLNMRAQLKPLATLQAG